MDILRERNGKKIWFSQENYIQKVLQKFNMQNRALLTRNARACPYANHYRLSSKQSPSINEEKEEMDKVAYVSTIASLIFVIVCT